MSDAAAVCAALGWDQGWARALSALPGEPARVARVDRGRVQAIGAGGSVSLAAPTGADAPVTGDWISVSGDDGHPVVGARAPRRTALVRRDPADEPRPQVLAANMDEVWIVHALDHPLRSGWLDRALVVAYGSGAEPLIVVTKADLAGGDAVVGRIAALTPGVPAVRTSSEGQMGLDELLPRLDDGRGAALLGRSGSGKSSLINALSGVATHRTAAVRAGDAKGRHTTTRRALTFVGGGTLIDMPGVRALGLWEPAAGLALAFPDVAELATHCRFSDCTHRHEPGCAVGDAVANHRLEDERYGRYMTLSS